MAGLNQTVTRGGRVRLAWTQGFLGLDRGVEAQDAAFECLKTRWLFAAALTHLWTSEVVDMMSHATERAWLLVVLTALGCVACGGGGSDPPPAGTRIDNLVLGSGTDIFGEYATEANVKGRVLDLDALNAYGMLTINTNVEEATFIHASGTDISEYASSLGVTVGVSGHYKFFSGSIDTRFDQEFYSSTESSFATVHELVKKASLKVSDHYQSGSALRSFMTPQAAEALASWPAHEIIARYGTHVMVGIYEGARLDYSLGITITDQVDRETIGVYASAAYKQMFASAQVDTSVTTEEMNRFQSYRKEIRVQAKGGTAQFAYCSSDNPEVCESTRLAWLNSIDANPVFCAIMYNGLISIWEFAANAERSAEIEAYYRAYGLGKHMDYHFPRYDVTGLTVTDHHWGLMWARKLDGEHVDPNYAATTRFGWNYAMDGVHVTANVQRHAGYEDWRVPSFDELWTLVDHSRAPAALVYDGFGMIDGVYWSTTDDASNPAQTKSLMLNFGLTQATPFALPKNNEQGAAVILLRDAY
jgi:hypothetical protein